MKTRLKENSGNSPVFVIYKEKCFCTVCDLAIWSFAVKLGQYNARFNSNQRTNFDRKHFHIS